MSAFALKSGHVFKKRVVRVFDDGHWVYVSPRLFSDSALSHVVQEEVEAEFEVQE